ncbi:cytochrome P450 [Conexibacter arvalis]|uniref:Cytochrome P450 n=1 Tax=Conexibacter arvalis TaxID=912552 RepID=A0A840I9G0_9ACTN|nr:cytochrome P450 [Conexibacter arvalis]MBB4661549.1 cytochrome P450 [Conexibacter arvalis]
MDPLPPGPRLPRAAQTLRWIVRPTAFMEEQARRFGDTFTVRLLNSPPMVFVSDPEALREVFTADPGVLRAGVANQLLEPVLGANSLLLLDGERHLRQRRLMLPSFHGERIARLRGAIEALAVREVASWPLGEPLALMSRMQALTLEAIARVVFGVEEGARLELLRARLRELLDWSADRRRLIALALASATPLRARSLGGLRAVLRPVHELLDAEARDRRALPPAALAAREDVLSLLLQARDEQGGALTDAELRDELVTLLIAGHETTATALAWAVERLLRHPAALRRLRDELAEQPAGGDWLDAVAKETLRLRPILPIVARWAAEPFELRGRTLPAGTEIAPCIYLTHRRPDLYPDPHAFRPERFLERPAGTYTWLPFGGGPRRCLGASFALLELKTVLATIVRETELRPARPAPERIRRHAITWAPEAGAAVVVARRRPALSVV